MKRKTVLLTGATGNMGREALKQLYANKNKYKIVVLALPTWFDKQILSLYKEDDSVSIVWGDLTNFEDVKKAVSQADIVLHVGAFVSPAADKNPDWAWKINFGGTRNIVNAILEREDRDRVKLVYIGTVAETGNRPPPIHWGRIGDPLVPSVYDYYALSKIAAERYVIESGLKNWVSLRQTGILHPNILKVNDGIGYHQPLNNHLEWVTAHDSGLLLLNVCSDEVSEDFWCKVYNIGGGESCRLTAYQFTEKVYKLVGVDFKDLEDPNWYALRNFHGQWYLDSDTLDEYLHFRTESVDDLLQQLKGRVSLPMRLLKYTPKKLMKEMIRGAQIKKSNSPLFWIQKKVDAKIDAFFGSREKWEAIPGWDNFDLVVDPPHVLLDHGYDESKKDAELSISDMNKAAQFRGGKCNAETMIKGDLKTPLKWTCAQGHEFEASPFLVLKTGHWCNECIKAPWSFDEIAKTNPFIAQVWYASHEQDEDNRYF